MYWIKVGIVSFRLHNNIVISANMVFKLAYVPENHITKSKGKEN